MSDADDFVGCASGVLGLALVITLVAIGVMLTLSIGSVYGAGVAIQNYYLAFRSNVHPERATS